MERLTSNEGTEHTGQDLGQMTHNSVNNTIYTNAHGKIQKLPFESTEKKTEQWTTDNWPAYISKSHEAKELEAATRSDSRQPNRKGS